MKSKKALHLKAVIFDMDGVIVDSEPIESRAWEKVLLEFGAKPIFKSWGLINDPGNTFLKEIVERHGLKDQSSEIIKIKKRKYFEEFVQLGVAPIPGMIALMQKLKKAKIKTAIASSRNERQVRVVIQELEFNNEFDIIVGANEEIKRKPAPDIFLKTAQQLNVKPTDCVAIEDTENGIISAKAAGMYAIAVPNKWTKHQDFSKADKIVKSLSELTPLF